MIINPLVFQKKKRKDKTRDVYKDACCAGHKDKCVGHKQECDHTHPWEN